MGLNQRVTLANATALEVSPDYVLVTTIEVAETIGSVTEWVSMSTVLV